MLELSLKPLIFVLDMPGFCVFTASSVGTCSPNLFIIYFCKCPFFVLRLKKTCPMRFFNLIVRGGNAMCRGPSQSSTLASRQITGRQERTTRPRIRYAQPLKPPINFQLSIIPFFWQYRDASGDHRTLSPPRHAKLPEVGKGHASTATRFSSAQRPKFSRSP